MKFGDLAPEKAGEKSHPSRGAWIEIRMIRSAEGICSVAPLTGCVD